MRNEEALPDQLKVYRALLHQTSEKCEGHPLLIEPNMYRALLHQTSRNLIEKYRHTQCRWTSPTNWAQVYRALLHQTSITYWEMRPYPVQMDTPTDWAPCVQSLLHQTSITYWEMWRPSHTIWAQVYRALLHQTSINYWEMWRSIPHWLSPMCTEPY